MAHTQLHKAINKLRQQQQQQQQITSKGKSSRQFPPGQNLTLTPANWQTSFSAAQKKTKYAAQKQKKSKKEQQKQSLYNNGFNFQAGNTQRDCNKNNTKSN